MVAAGVALGLLARPAPRFGADALEPLKGPSRSTAGASARLVAAANGRFDPLGKRFVLGNATQVGGAPVLVKPRADGLGFVVRERHSEARALAVEVA